MRNFFCLLLLLLNGDLSTSREPFINPTGTYLLKGEVKKNKIVGRSGELRVRLLNVNTVAMCLYLNKGDPGYESGFLLDTLHYENDHFVYVPADDTSCAIYFVFTLKSVEIDRISSNPQRECGFRTGVLEPAIFDKISADIPVIEDLSGRGEIL
jgi:hypothetical protein